ncbi:MAG: hypothetical protein WDO70_10850 [Alphaproteobacteria bacterium]
MAIGPAIFYYTRIFRRLVEPHAISWFIWALTMGITWAAQYVSGGGAGSWSSGFYALSNLCVAILGVKYGKRNITRGDWLTLAVACMALPLWWATKDPFWSIVLITSIDILGFYPTLRKSWFRPFHESLMIFIPPVFVYILAVFALEAVNPTTALMPVAMILAHTAGAGIIIYRRRVVPREAA